MGVKQTVFGSRSERDCYYRLRERWAGRLNVWHNLPVSVVIDLYDDNDSYIKNLRRKTSFNSLVTGSIDYVFCEPVNDSPLLCVEFDGCTGGYNSGQNYFQRSKHDRKRYEKIKAKLDLANHYGLPFFVVSYPETDDISPNIKLAIVDGLIGEVLAEKDMQERYDRGEYRPEGLTAAEFAKLPMEEQHYLREYWHTTASYLTQLQNNRAFYALNEMGRPFKHQITFTTGAGGMLICKCTLYYWDNGKPVLTTGFSMPRFRASGHGSEQLAEQIALLLAFDEAARKRIDPRIMPIGFFEARVNPDTGEGCCYLVPNNAYPDKSELEKMGGKGRLMAGPIGPRASTEPTE
jgi:hypothetical protein